MWAKGLWSRLNGAPGQPGRDAPVALPLPTATEEARKQQIQQLNLELDGLEKKLQVGGCQAQTGLSLQRHGCVELCAGRGLRRACGGRRACRRSCRWWVGAGWLGAGWKVGWKAGGGQDEDGCC